MNAHIDPPSMPAGEDQLIPAATPTGQRVPLTCPYLGMAHDPETALAFLSSQNHCHCVQPSSQIKVDHQGRYCLSADFADCPVYLGEPAYDEAFVIRRRWWSELAAWIPQPIRAERTIFIVLLLVIISALLLAGWQNRAAGAARFPSDLPNMRAIERPSTRTATPPAATPTSSRRAAAVRPTAVSTRAVVKPTTPPTDAPPASPTPSPVPTEPPATATPVETAVSSETAVAAEPMARVRVSSTYLRQGPGTDYAIVRFLYEGDTVRLLGSNDAGTWHRVELENGWRGWVSELVVELVDS